mmetsp:Transcript_7232/g.14835  ORF Transcript_7232/g.14835 Transcript_7232/m.14835 type:complete len:357 (-) Transcript_7232:52-1122(-)
MNRRTRQLLMVISLVAMFLHGLLNVDTLATSLSQVIPTSLTASNATTTTKTHANPNAIRVYAPSNSTSTVAVCLIVKEELLYIDEWMDFHISLGFSPIYVYDNSANFEMHDWLENRRADIRQHIRLIHFPQAPAQVAAYTRCLQRDARNETYAALIDADEFVVLFQHDSVKDFMDRHCDEECGQISLNWKMMGTSNETHYKPVPVTKRNVHSPGVEGTIKVIVRPDYAADGDLGWSHSVKLKKGYWVDTSGKRIHNKGWKRQANQNAPTNVALLYHYRYKSEEEHVNKICKRDNVLKATGIHPMCDDEGRRRQYERGMHGTMFDDSAWKKMIQMVPKYAAFDNSSAMTSTISMYPI